MCVFIDVPVSSHPHILYMVKRAEVHGAHFTYGYTDIRILEAMAPNTHTPIPVAFQMPGGDLLRHAA